MTTPSCLKLAVLTALITHAAVAASADIVAIMAPGSAPLSKEQLANIYLGRTQDLKPLDLSDANPVREAFYRRATSRDAAQIKAVWSRVVFTGKGQPPKELADAAAMKKALAADPKAIGYIERSALDNTVTVVLQLD